MKKTKKIISKIMLVLSLLFLLLVLFSIIDAIHEPIFFRETEKLTLIAYLALSGLFLGLYRIIDLLEQK